MAQVTLALPCEAMHYADNRGGATIILSRPLTRAEREKLVADNPDFRIRFPDRETITIQ